MADIGHAHFGPGIEHEFDIMKDGIRSLHLHDNNGEQDQHLFPTMNSGGTIDWKKAMQLLRSRPDQYPLLLELKEVPEYGPHPFDKAAKIFETLENL